MEIQLTGTSRRIVAEPLIADVRGGPAGLGYRLHVPGMPPRELFFYVFGLAWRTHDISFAHMFEDKCSKFRGSNKSTCRARRLRGWRET
jgi:hypothetical protein